MKKLMPIYVFLVLLIVSPVSVFADLKVQVSKESELPFSLSPQNPVNSPDDSSNSVKNSSYSATNPNNTSSNSENSPSKTENSMTGNRRMLFEKDGTYYFIGYFVLGENKLINFFSPYGKRMFYTPPGSSALFGSEDGVFCGALSTANNKTVLMLTEKGQATLTKEGVPPFRPTDTNIRKTISGVYNDDGKEHYVDGNYNGGGTLVLDNGSMWEIDPVDKLVTALWKNEAVITISTSNGGKYDYLLSNSEDGKEVHANFLGVK